MKRRHAGSVRRARTTAPAEPTSTDCSRACAQRELVLWWCRGTLVCGRGHPDTTKQTGAQAQHGHRTAHGTARGADLDGLLVQGLRGGCQA